MERKWVSIQWLKDFLVLAGLVVALVAVGSIFWQGIANKVEFDRAISTHYEQAYQAANPLGFSQALRSLNQALDEAGMKEGNPYFLVEMSQQNDMSYRRARYEALIERAGKLSDYGLGSTEVSTGLADLRKVLYSVPPGPFWFWMWLQGGAWAVFWWPFIIVGAGIAVVIISGLLPQSIRVRVRGPRPAPR